MLVFVGKPQNPHHHPTHTPAFQGSVDAKASDKEEVAFLMERKESGVLGG